MSTSDTGEGQTSAGALRPLRERPFLDLWIAALVSNIGTWVQNVGAAWFMASLSDSPLVVSLVQSATYLPVALIGLFAGALADVVDRRRLLPVTQAWMMSAAAVLAVPAAVIAMVVLGGGAVSENQSQNESSNSRPPERDRWPRSASTSRSLARTVVIHSANGASPAATQ